MHIMRIISSGRLSEHFGIEMIKTDKFMRSIGLRRIAEKWLDYLEP